MIGKKVLFQYYPQKLRSYEPTYTIDWDYYNKMKNDAGYNYWNRKGEIIDAYTIKDKRIYLIKWIDCKENDRFISSVDSDFCEITKGQILEFIYEEFNF